MTYRLHGRSAARRPVYVFHHIPKCGGTSVVKALGCWFHLALDYRHGWRDSIARPFALDRMRASHCLCGHFDQAPFYIEQRYPGLLDDPEFRVFSFIRDPLQAKLSLYRYEQKFGRVKVPFEQFLFERPNYLSQRFPVDAATITPFLDRYRFIGTVENMQRGLDWLAADIGRDPILLRRANQTARQGSKSGLDSGLIEEFRAENSVDYALFDYAKARESAAFDDRRCAVQVAQ